MDSKEEASGSRPTSGDDVINLNDSTTVTMLEVLEQEEELEEEYAAVLGGSDEKCCTYTQGPVKRQALYSCLTCRPQSKYSLDECAGICLACSLSCHENHELVELYTKRNFRCDCPTEKFADKCCVLNATLEGPQPRIEDNLYNQNFQGLYCICHRPYPDPDRSAEETMLQCAVCEDWLHLEHLGLDPPPEASVTAANEMICEACMQRSSFLRDYTGLALNTVENANESRLNSGDSHDVSVDVEKGESVKMIENEPNVPTHGNNAKAGIDKPQEAAVEQNKKEPDECEPPKKKRKLSDGSESPSGSNANNQLECRRPKGKTDYDKGATFWNNDWRSLLCRCEACVQLYKNEKMEFLLDEEDSVKAYEERGMKRAAPETSTYEQAIRALSSIDRVAQIDAIGAYNRMKDRLVDYFRTFAASNTVVTKEDINRFFAEMRNEKQTYSGPQYFCR